MDYLKKLKTLSQNGVTQPQDVELNKEKKSKPEDTSQKSNTRKKIFYDLKPTERFCPFRGDVYTVLPCSKRCKLYDPRRSKGYECIFYALTQLTWDAKELLSLLTGNNLKNNQEF